MLSTPEIIQTTSQPAAVIRLTVPRSEMMKVFGPAVGELMAALAAQGVAPIGAVFAHHLKMSPDIFDFEFVAFAIVDRLARHNGCRSSKTHRRLRRLRRASQDAHKVVRTLNRRLKARQCSGNNSGRWCTKRRQGGWADA